MKDAGIRWRRLRWEPECVAGCKHRLCRSGTDTGHPGGNCEPGVNPHGTYNFTFIDDFIRVAIKQQVLRSKSLATAYYGTQPAYNYWNGCSTGGRQGYLLAQKIGNELRGILANAPAMYWTDLDGPDVGSDSHERTDGWAYRSQKAHLRDQCCG